MIACEVVAAAACGGDGAAGRMPLPGTSLPAKAHSPLALEETDEQVAALAWRLALPPARLGRLAGERHRAQSAALMISSCFPQGAESLGCHKQTGFR